MSPEAFQSWTPQPRRHDPRFVDCNDNRPRVELFQRAVPSHVTIRWNGNQNSTRFPHATPCRAGVTDRPIFLSAWAVSSTHFSASYERSSGVKRSEASLVGGTSSAYSHSSLVERSVRMKASHPGAGSIDQREKRNRSAIRHHNTISPPSPERIASV